MVFEISRPPLEAKDCPEAEVERLQPEEVEEQDPQPLFIAESWPPSIIAF